MSLSSSRGGFSPRWLCMEVAMQETVFLLALTDSEPIFWLAATLFRQQWNTPQTPKQSFPQHILEQILQNQAAFPGRLRFVSYTSTSGWGPSNESFTACMARVVNANTRFRGESQCSSIHSLANHSTNVCHELLIQNFRPRPWPMASSTSKCYSSCCNKEGKGGSIVDCFGSAIHGHTTN